MKDTDLIELNLPQGAVRIVNCSRSWVVFNDPSEARRFTYWRFYRRPDGVIMAKSVLGKQQPLETLTGFYVVTAKHRR